MMVLQQVRQLQKLTIFSYWQKVITICDKKEVIKVFLS